MVSPIEMIPKENQQCFRIEHLNPEFHATRTVHFPSLEILSGTGNRSAACCTKR